MKQDDLLFDRARERASTRRDTGMMAAADHADRIKRGWTDIAYAELCAYVADRPCDFTIDRARFLRLDEAVPPPPDKRAWGSVIKRAIKSGVIIPTGGYDRSTSSNLSPMAVYRAGVWVAK